MKQPITNIPSSRYCKNFKDGIADAVLIGVEVVPDEHAEGYKDGYEFGLTLHERLNHEKEEE